MIGVIADTTDHEVVREFFQLFKTPWEFWSPDKQYDVVLCNGDAVVEGTPKAIVVYAGRPTPFDDQHRIPTGRQRNSNCMLCHRGDRIPIYGGTITFRNDGDLLVDEVSHESIAHLDKRKGITLCRLGYDIFAEIRNLLTVGQPVTTAGIPTLELHIALLRNLIIDCGVSLVEIPPVPQGYQCIACLTHDVDHPSIRKHKWDHTSFGFVYRAIFGSLRNVVNGRITIRDWITNLAAAFSLPFVYLGIAKDFWGEFGDRYLALENGLRSTFFIIPFKDRPGKRSKGSSPSSRAARYGAQDIEPTIRKLRMSGCEIGLHGVDAWLDCSAARQELEQIRRITGASEIGVRMHWLYFDQKSAVALEEAGASYDSTMGYNETIGYRAGTTQAYKPLGATRLLELPLHVMDTALFYPSYLDLSSKEAREVLSRFLDNANSFGGCLTINWHDRSIAPERLWQASYESLISELQTRGAWFATAEEVVSWFRKRRAAVFESGHFDLDASRAKLTDDCGDHLPGLQLRVHKAPQCSSGYRGSDGYVDIPIDETVAAGVRCADC
jgi:hypothetical protein